MRKFVRYDNIKHEHNGEGKVPYELLLSTIEWREFRENILIRDNYIAKIAIRNKQKNYILTTPSIFESQLRKRLTSVLFQYL